jgi:hypothetical protein
MPRMKTRTVLLLKLKDVAHRFNSQLNDVALWREEIRILSERRRGLERCLQDIVLVPGLYG